MKQYLIFGILIAQIGFGQSKKFQGQATSITTNKISSTTDTLTPPSFSLGCYTNQNILYYADYYAPHDSGFVTGNNIYADLEKAQLYTNTQTVTVTGCLALGYRSASGSATNSTIKIYSKNSSTGYPQTLLGTSLPRTQNSLTNNAFNTFTFSPPITYTADFFVSYVLPQNAGDTIGVYSTYVTCHSPTTLAYEMAGGNIWGKIKTNWGFTGTNDLDLVLLPLIQNNSTGISENNSTKNIFFTNDNEHLFFKNLEAGAEINIIEMQGKICRSDILRSDKVDISQLQPGLYFCILKTNEGIALKAKFIKL